MMHSSEMHATFGPALPFFLLGGPEAVLLIHGYTGITDEFRYLGRRLNEAGFTVSVPRLPGHGTNGEDFVSTNARDWVRRIADEYLDLRALHGKVHLCGLSMGALIALILAERYGVGKIVLAAPAIKAKDGRIFLTPFLRRFLRTLPRPDYVFEGPPEYRPVAREYWEKTWVGPAAELLSLQRLARKALPGISAKTLVIASERDDTVPLEAMNIIESRIGSKDVSRLVLRESGHVVVNGSEKERVSDAIISFLTEGS